MNKAIKKFNKLPRNKRHTIVTATIVLVVVAVLFAVDKFYDKPLWQNANKDMEVISDVIEEKNKFYSYYIDVGQGDCEMLKCNNDVVLIDAGDANEYTKIQHTLNAQGVTEINYLIITHMHSDHMYNVQKILSEYRVNNIIMSKLSESNTPTTDLYEKTIDAIANSGAKVYAANPGDKYDLSSFSFNILGPYGQPDNLNNTSVIVRVQFGNTSFLYMGDAETGEEKELMKSGFDYSADVLKLGHHGSKTSTGSKFLANVNPQIAVASCGAGNKYKHPNTETVDKLKKNNVTLYRTDIQGTITVISDGNNFTVRTEEGI